MFRQRKGVFLTGFLLAQGLAVPGVSGPPPVRGLGTLEVEIRGNGKICARLHEPELVKIISPDEYPQRQFTTYGYRLRLFAISRSHGEPPYVLMDTSRVPTVERKALEKPRRSRNPVPRPLAKSRGPRFVERWITHPACSSLPDRQKFLLPEGEYDMQFRYQVQAPNRSWFTLIEVNSAPVRVRPGETTSVIAKLQDDGRQREVGFVDGE